MEKVKNLEKITNEVIDLSIAIQQIPSPTFAEARRSIYIRDLFVQKELSDVSTDALGNVYARLKGSGNRLPIIFSAHLDTVFPEPTDLSLRRTADLIFGPGISDNALGLASLAGLVDLVRLMKKLPGDIWLVANVCEEGLGNLKGMEAVVERFGKDVSAYIVVEGTTLGKIYHRALGVQRYRITAKTTGGHSWADYGRRSAVHELANLVTRLTQLDLPKEPRTTLNVGLFQGGMSVNSIASEACLELDLRSESATTLAELVERVKRIVQETNREEDDFVRVSAELIGLRPAGEISWNHPLVRLASHCLEEQGITPHIGIGSTDANVPISKGLPAICVGLTRGSGSHTIHECMFTQPVAQGLQLLAGLASGIFQSGKP